MTKPEDAPTAEAAGSQVDRHVRRLVERLRAWNPDECHEPVELLHAAASELESLSALVVELQAWQAQGEALLSKQGLSAAFSLGRWWADRPWRKRPLAEPGKPCAEKHLPKDAANG